MEKTLSQKLRGSCEWTKVYFDKELVDAGQPVIVTDIQGVQYRLEECLGQGYEGEVWKVARLNNAGDQWGPPLALKFEIGDIDIGQHLKKEYDLLASLDHPYIVKPIKYWLSPMMGPSDQTDTIDRGHMLTFFIEGHHLDPTQLKSPDAVQILLDLISVIRYLNVDAKIYHGDLKTDNIIITTLESFKYPVLIDFGFSGPIENQPYLDRKLLGLIYLLMVGLTQRQIIQFKKNINWFAHLDRTYQPAEIKAAIADIFRLKPHQLKILNAFFDGSSHNELYSLIRTISKI